MNSQLISRVTKHKYLGITVSHDTKWHEHINSTHMKGTKTLGLLRRILHPCSKEVKKKAYEALVRSTMEYATSTWSPHTKQNQTKLEQMQRQLQDLFSDYSYFNSVTTIIAALKWDSLQTRCIFKA